MTPLRKALADRLAAELDDAARWLAPIPDPLGGAEVVDGSAPRSLVLHEMDEEGRVRHVITADISDEERDVRQAEEQAAREEEAARGLAAAIATVRASFDAVIEKTEKMVGDLVDVVVPSPDLRPAVQARIRADLVAWPTPWVRPRGFVDVPVFRDERRTGTVRTYGLAGSEEREERERHPELAALARIMVEREARRIAGDHPDALQEARRVLAGHERDAVASEAWKAIGDAAEAGEALRLAARLSGADLAHAAASGARGRRAEGPRLARGDVDHVEVPRVGWVYASTLALVGRALQEVTRPAELAALAARTVLDKAGDSELAQRPEAHQELARAVEDWLSRAPACSDEVEVVDGVHPLDEALAALLDSIGETGRDAARQIRESRKSPQERANRWRPYAEPLRVPRALAGVLWADVVAVAFRHIDEQAAKGSTRRERQALVPAPTIHPATRTAVMLASHGARRAEDGSVSFGEESRRMGYLPPVASVSVGERALSEGAGKAVPLLAAWLAMAAWERWRNMVPRFDWIAFPVGRSALRERGITVEEEHELDEAIAFLQELKVGGLPCIDASPPPEEVQEDERRNGRPEKRRLLRVGAPLAPMGLESVYRSAGMTLPPELRFFSPVLNPAEAPLTGNRQTYARQRDFFALGLGSFFVQHREEYAERGGVQIDAQRWRSHLTANGIYHRSHQSLADQMLDAYRSHRKPGLPGIGPRATVLVETASGSGVYRFGPHFAEQERVVLNAAETTAKRKRDAQKRRAAGRRRPKDAP
jgi:hypothetical protein